MNYRGVLVAKTLLHRDFLKNYRKAPKTTSEGRKLQILSLSSHLTVEGLPPRVLTLLAAFVHGGKLPWHWEKKQNKTNPTVGAIGKTCSF